MDYTSANYGTSKAGVDQLLEAIKREMITKVADKCVETNEIVTACQQNWHGTSCDNFLNNLNKDTQVLQESLYALYNALAGEINAASSAILDFDQNLINER